MNLPALRPPMIFGALRPGMNLPALRPPMIFGALRRIICRSWFLIPAKRALRPGMSLPALRPGVVFASHASTDALQCLASADDLRRLAPCLQLLSEDGEPMTVDLRGFLRSSITSSRQRASLPRMVFRASLPAQQHHFLIDHRCFSAHCVLLATLVGGR